MAMTDVKMATAAIFQFDECRKKRNTEQEKEKKETSDNSWIKIRASLPVQIHKVFRGSNIAPFPIKEGERKHKIVETYTDR